MKKLVSLPVLLTLLATGTAFAQKVTLTGIVALIFPSSIPMPGSPAHIRPKALWNQRVIAAVNKRLQSKGLQLVDSDPDL